MTVQLWVPQPSIAPSPADAAAYLLQQGWTLESASASWAVYLKRFDGFDGQPVKLEVPQQAAAPDYGRAFGNLIDDLARLEQRAPSSLLRDISASSVASGKIDPFRERTRDGVSANLCDGIAEILDATSADTLRAAFSFAPRRPLLAEVPRAIAFSSDTSGILREAAKRMREDASYPATEVFGTVVKLDSPNSAIGGEVVLRVEVPDGRLRRVRVVLDATPYQVAIEAHGARTLVRCVGDLAREGGSWVLRNPRDFAATEQDD